MPGKRKRVPSYRLHKPSGQAGVILAGQHIYLGKFGTPERWDKYRRLIASRLNGQGPARLGAKRIAVPCWILNASPCDAW